MTDAYTMIKEGFCTVAKALFFYKMRIQFFLLIIQLDLSNG